VEGDPEQKIPTYEDIKIKTKFNAKLTLSYERDGGRNNLLE
jgi:hypothetical protein